VLRGAQCGCLALQLTESDRFFSPQPFFHVGGSIQVMLTPVVSGCTMIVQPYFDAGEALVLMERHRCNVLMGHQPHFIEYLNHRDLPKRKLVLEKDMIFASPEVNKRVHDEIGIMKLISPLRFDRDSYRRHRMRIGRSVGVENDQRRPADARGGDRYSRTER
jgi:acyl-CoA synthetase (AMP-forming)/AMP-acid ligase II